MVSIEYGGGPTVEQRRKFCNLEDGGHIPGYMGFCPQFNYRAGKTYGNETSQIAAVGIRIISPHPSSSCPPTGSPLLQRTTDTGNVPHLNFKFGATFRQCANESVDEFVRTYKCQEQKREELREVAGLFPALRPISMDPRVRDHLNVWSDDLIKSNTTVKPVRGPTDPPIPGYQGFVPRMDSTDAGLSKRYNIAARSALETFRAESQGHWDRLAEPSTSVNTERSVQNTLHRLPSEKYISSRIFHQDGMIPNYDGHVHGYKYHAGQNYGNTTRDLEVCAHPFPSYGEYVKEKDVASKYTR